MASAQLPGDAGEAPEPTWTLLREHDEARSRAAFAACDEDRDDRISLFEAARRIDGLQDLRDISVFRELDTSADGFLQWPEFDQRYRQLVETGRPLRLKPARPIALPPSTPAGGVPPAIRQLLQRLDDDRDGRIGLAALTAAIEQMGFAKAAAAHVPRLDRDGSGDLDAAELAVLVPLLGGTPADRGDAGTSPLPPEHAAADQNGDGTIGLLELDAALKSLHPGLTRWTRTILTDADESGDGAIGSAEILRATSRQDTR